MKRNSNKKMSLKIPAKLIFVLLIISCNLDSNYFPHNEGKKIFYDVFFEDKEKTKKSNKYLPWGDKIAV